MMSYNSRRPSTTIFTQQVLLLTLAAAQLLAGTVVSCYAIIPSKLLTTKNTAWIQNEGNVASRTIRLNQQSNQNNGDATVEPDLFEYFDPLLSPHAYPNGIGASDITTNDSKKINSLVRYDDEEEEVKEEKGAKESNNLSLQDDDFGWGSSSGRSNAVSKKSYQLKKPFGISLPGSDDAVNDEDKIQASLSSSARTESLNIDTSAIFDPTLSPHMYTNGFVPEVIIGDDIQNADHDNASGNNRETVIIGILLMDHGSRSAASNERLHELANLYQQQFAVATRSPKQNNNIHVVVKAAHMEIALPSIEDGLSALLQENVQEIICHPYFLSPGRHVVEDIPQLVNAAIEALSISIPVKTTPPIGSETSIMINAINSLVNETSEFLQRK